MGWLSGRYCWCDFGVISDSFVCGNVGGYLISFWYDFGVFEIVWIVWCENRFVLSFKILCGMLVLWGGIYLFNCYEGFVGCWWEFWWCYVVCKCL